MAEFDEVAALIRTKVEAAAAPLAVHFRNENNVLPAVPVPYCVCEPINENAFFAGFGGGRGQNLQRTTGRLEVHLLWPKGKGYREALIAGKAIKNAFVGYRDGVISCFAAQFFPAQGASDEGNYVIIGTVIVILHFDGVG